ncbi:MAG: diacylglycerol kinase family lipid kinase [Eubacterium sp.]|nr:diacylglycerol kinase family lipid kinase [Eubacterium sp.]
MYYFIVNYTGGSGKARKTWNRVHFLLKEKGIEYKAYATKRAGHAGELAKNISEIDDDDIRLIVVGGDGTINEVLNGITDFSKVRLGLIPTGSGNDFSRGLGITKNTDQALDIILSSVEGKTIDIGEVTTGDGKKRYFGISSGIGLDAIVCKKNDSSKVKKILNKLGIGSLSYIVLTITTLFSMETYDVKVKLKYSEMEEDGDKAVLVEEKHFDKLIFLVAMNFFAEGGGVPMNPNATADDGLLSICAVAGIPKWKTFFKLPLLTKGKHEGKKGFVLKDVEGLVFDADRPMVLHADGEYIGDETHIEMNVIRNAINVMI